MLRSGAYTFTAMNMSPKAAANHAAKAAAFMARRTGLLSIIQYSLASMALPSCAMERTPRVFVSAWEQIRWHGADSSGGMKKFTELKVCDYDDPEDRGLIRCAGLVTGPD